MSSSSSLLIYTAGWYFGEARSSPWLRHCKGVGKNARLHLYFFPLLLLLQRGAKYSSSSVRRASAVWCPPPLFFFFFFRRVLLFFLSIREQPSSPRVVRVWRERKKLRFCCSAAKTMGWDALSTSIYLYLICMYLFSLAKHARTRVYETCTRENGGQRKIYTMGTTLPCCLKHFDGYSS